MKQYPYTSQWQRYNDEQCIRSVMPMVKKLKGTLEVELFENGFKRYFKYTSRWGGVKMFDEYLQLVRFLRLETNCPHTTYPCTCGEGKL